MCCIRVCVVAPALFQLVNTLCYTTRMCLPPCNSLLKMFEDENQLPPPPPPACTAVTPDLRPTPLLPSCRPRPCLLICMSCCCIGARSGIREATTVGKSATWHSCRRVSRPIPFFHLSSNLCIGCSTFFLEHASHLFVARKFKFSSLGSTSCTGLFVSKKEFQ
jgi:hypothetical protein